MFPKLAISLSLIFGLSCKSQEQKNLPLQAGDSLDFMAMNFKHTGVNYHFDTTLYFKHKSGFYLSKSGEIFQLNRVVLDDSIGFSSDHFWLDSLMFYGEYPNQRRLRNIVNLETFVTDTLSRFEKDKNNVYYAWGTTDGVQRFIVESADPKTFVALGQYYGKDKSNVFYGSEIVKNADLKTFHVFGDSAKDKNHTYYSGEKAD